jgi:hypothetical protein
MKTCPECGKPMRGLSRRRRLALWVRARLERLAFLVDRWTVEPFDSATASHLHLTDEEWADFDENTP